MTRIARVTVGVPVYNEVKYIESQLEYLRTQDFDDIEVLIYDNASTDATPEIARRYCDMDPRFRYFRQPQNKGPLPNFDDVVQAARSPYFMWRACDDRSDKNYIAELVRVLDEHPEAELAVSPVVTVDLDGVIMRTSQPLEISAGVPKSDRERVRQLFNYHVSWIYGLFRRPLLAERMKSTVEKYGDEFGADHTILFRYVFDGSVAASSATRFEQVVKTTEEIRRESRKKFNMKLRRVIPLRRRFFRICRHHIDQRIPAGARRLSWYGIAWLYVGRRLYKLRKIIVQSLSMTLKTAPSR